MTEELVYKYPQYPRRRKKAKYLKRKYMVIINGWMWLGGRKPQEAIRYRRTWLGAQIALRWVIWCYMTNGTAEVYKKTDRNAEWSR